MRRIKHNAVECPTEHTLKVIGGGWKLPLVYFLFEKERRYSEIQRQLKGISPRMLTRQLRELERDGLLNRKVYPEIPPKVEYSLTPLGFSLKPIVKAMFRWGAEHLAAQNRSKTATRRL